MSGTKPVVIRPITGSGVLGTPDADEEEALWQDYIAHQTYDRCPVCGVELRESNLIRWGYCSSECERIDNEEEVT